MPTPGNGTMHLWQSRFERAVMLHSTVTYKELVEEEFSKLVEEEFTKQSSTTDVFNLQPYA
jgi:hypothetical protein